MQHYHGQDWLSYEFPRTPSRLYVLNLQEDWSNRAYEKVRFVDAGSIDWCHSMVIFFGHHPVVTPIEVNFSSSGRKRRGGNELFDYSQVDIRKAAGLYEGWEEYHDEREYSYTCTLDTNSPLSYIDVVDLVATVALEYPYFTWDDEGTFQLHAEEVRRRGINECDCRTFAARLIAQASVDSKRATAVLSEGLGQVLARAEEAWSGYSAEEGAVVGMPPEPLSECV